MAGMDVLDTWTLARVRDSIDDPGVNSRFSKPRPLGSEVHDEGVRTLAPGVSRVGEVDFAGDTDRFRMNLEPGTYMISLRGTGDNPLLDPYLTSRNAGIADDDDGGDRNQFPAHLHRDGGGRLRFRCRRLPGQRADRRIHRPPRADGCRQRAEPPS